MVSFKASTQTMPRGRETGNPTGMTVPAAQPPWFASKYAQRPKAQSHKSPVTCRREARAGRGARACGFFWFLRFFQPYYTRGRHPPAGSLPQRLVGAGHLSHGSKNDHFLCRDKHVCLPLLYPGRTAPRGFPATTLGRGRSPLPVGQKTIIFSAAARRTFATAGIRSVPVPLPCTHVQHDDRPSAPEADASLDATHPAVRQLSWGTTPLDHGI